MGKKGIKGFRGEREGLRSEGKGQGRRGLREKRAREGGKGPVVEGWGQVRRKIRKGTSRERRGQVKKGGARGRRRGPKGEGNGKGRMKET